MLEPHSHLDHLYCSLGCWFIPWVQTAQNGRSKRSSVRHQAGLADRSQRRASLICDVDVVLRNQFPLLGDRRVKVLVTGAAGFIGSQTPNALVERGGQNGWSDKLNHYYDVSLKRARLAGLERHGKVYFVLDALV